MAELHPIEDFCYRRGIPLARFARGIGRSRGYVGDLVKGRAVPSVETIRDIVAATDGEISASSLVEWGAPPSPHADSLADPTDGSGGTENAA